jgi:hypothetical protein
MPILVLTWTNNEAAANDVTYVIRRDKESGWWWCWAKIPTRSEPMRLNRPAGFHGLEHEARELAQEDAEKRGEVDRAREPQIRRIRA